MADKEYARRKSVPSDAGYVIKPLIVTFKQLVRSTINRPNTVLYPWEKVELPDCYRGRPGLIIDRCIGCGVCARICPNRCIKLVELDDPKLGKVKRPQVDVGRCMMCGYCAEYCPKQAMIVTPEYELASEVRGDLIYDPYSLRYPHKPGYEVHLIEVLPSELRGRPKAEKTDHDYPVLIDEKCIGCQRCAKVCPTDAIKMVEVGTNEKGKPIRRPLIDLSKCVACENCVEDCPKYALEMKVVL